MTRASSGTGHESFSAALQARMFRYGLNQRQAAEELGVAPQAVSDWINERRYPSAALVPALAAWLDIDTEQLRGMLRDRQTPAELNRELRQLRSELEQFKAEFAAFVAAVDRRLAVKAKRSGDGASDRRVAPGE